MINTKEKCLKCQKHAVGFAWICHVAVVMQFTYKLKHVILNDNTSEIISLKVSLLFMNIKSAVFTHFDTTCMYQTMLHLLV